MNYQPVRLMQREWIIQVLIDSYTCTNIIIGKKLNVTSVVDENNCEVTFNWSKIHLNCMDVHPHYTILSSNCGSCPTTTTNTTVTCTDVHYDDGVCTFAVQTVVCGNITQSGNWSGELHVDQQVWTTPKSRNSDQH